MSDIRVVGIGHRKTCFPGARALMLADGAAPEKRLTRGRLLALFAEPAALPGRDRGLRNHPDDRPARLPRWAMR